MNLSKRKVLLITILILTILLYCWMDELYIKQMGFLDHKYEILKIALHSGLAYKLANYLIIRLKLDNKFNSVHPLKLFTFVFVLCNSYLITQYVSRAISNRLINNEVRNELNRRTIKLEHAGWGYECDSLNYSEFKELTKSSKIIDIQPEAKSIFAYDWYEFDFRRTVEFEVPKEFKIYDYYKNDSLILNNLEKIEYGSFVSRTTFNEYGRINDAIQIQFDTSKFFRFKYEVSDN